MKRRYLAMVLGLVLAIAPTSAFAEEAENIAVEAVTEPADDELIVVDTATESADGENLIAVEEVAEADAEEGAGDGAIAEAAELENQFWGKVTAVDDTSITISVGTLGGADMPGGPGSAPGEMPENMEMPDGEAGDSEMTGEAAVDEEGTNAEAASDEDAVSGEETTNAATGENANSEVTGEMSAEGDLEMPEEMSAYEALELTGEEMTVAITDDTEVYFVYGDTDIAALKMTAWDYANENGELVFEITAEDAAGEAASDEVAEDGEDTLTDADLEEDAEAGSEEPAEKDAEEVSEEPAEEDAEEVSEEPAGEMNKMVSLTVESAAAESIITDDLVNITLDEDGNAAVILIVMPEADAEV